MKEVWLDCVGFEGFYQVSNFGNVRSVERMVMNRVGNGLRKSPAKLLKQCLSKSGYWIVSFCADGVKSNQTVHRLVCRAFIDNPKNKPQVNHKNGIKTDNQVSNLEWVTVSENGLHAYRVLGVQAWNKGIKLKAEFDAYKATHP
jgi:hypothetical protein